MKIKKTISERVISANRQNAQHSTGPRNVAAIRYNAVTHGILAKGVVFHSDQEEGDFKELLRCLQHDLLPADMLERLLIEEIAMCYWKLRIALRLEPEDIRMRQTSSSELLSRLISNCDDETLSALTDTAQAQDSGSTPRQGWDCSEVVITASPQKGDVFRKELGEMAGKMNVQVRLTSALETIMRYQGALKRDLFRAIRALLDLQRRREEKSVGEKQSKRKPPKSIDSAKQSH